MILLILKKNICNIYNMTESIGSKIGYGFSENTYWRGNGNAGYSDLQPYSVISESRPLHIGGSRHRRLKSKKKTNKKSKNNRKMRLRKKSRKHKHTKYCKHYKKSNKKKTRKYRKMRGGNCGMQHYHTGGGCGCMNGGSSCQKQMSGGSCGNLLSSSGYGLDGNSGGNYGETSNPMPHSAYNWRN